MRSTVIAFDVDGTILNSEKSRPGLFVANEATRSGLIWMSSMKNVKIIVWSGSGELWANQVVDALGLRKYVWRVMAKNVIGRDEKGHPIITAGITPDVAVDDIQACNLGIINLIVREK